MIAENILMLSDAKQAIILSTCRFFDLSDGVHIIWGYALPIQIKTTQNPLRQSENFSAFANPFHGFGVVAVIQIIRSLHKCTSLSPQFAAERTLSSSCCVYAQIEIEAQAAIQNTISCFIF
jgi:hypothetical protein